MINLLDNTVILRDGTLIRVHPERESLLDKINDRGFRYNAVFKFEKYIVPKRMLDEFKKLHYEYLGCLTTKRQVIEENQ